jgi:ATP-dependent Lon protease
MLSIIPLSYPLILLPAARITLPLTKEQARTIIAQLHENNDRSQPTKNTLGALPVTPPQSEATDAPIQVAKWGCVARIVRLIRPSPLQQPGQHFIVIQGLNRFQLLEEPVFTREDLSAGLKTVRVAIPPSDLRSHPNPTTIREFKEAAIKLLSRLNKDTSTNSARKEAWLRLTDLMDEIEDERLAWFADVMVGAVAREYNDKLGMFLLSPTLRIPHTNHRLPMHSRSRDPAHESNWYIHETSLHLRSDYQDLHRRLRVALKAAERVFPASTARCDPARTVKLDWGQVGRL